MLGVVHSWSTFFKAKIHIYIFQARLFVGITRLLSRTKSTLLLKNRMHCTAIYMKTHCLQTNKTQHCLGKESALGAIAGERVVLIKSLISEDALGAQGCQVQLKSSADTL